MNQRAHRFSCTRIGQETLFGKNLWRINEFYYSYKRAFLTSGYLIPPSSGKEHITLQQCAICPQLPKTMELSIKPSHGG